MTDKRIIGLFTDRDEDALGEVIKKYGDFCLAIAKDNTPTTEEAEECVNDALIELWHRVPEDKPRDLRAYIADTVVRSALGRSGVKSDYEKYEKYINKKRGAHPLAVAAAVLLLCLIPAMIFLPPKAPTEVTEPEESTSPSEPGTETEAVTQPLVFEHDGTEGLLYEIAEDGKSARFIGFGDCKEETVVIASVCNGLPVTKMLLGELRDLGNTENAAIKSLTDYGSQYLKHLIISDTVEVVGNEIISSCANIESVYYGKNVRDIGKYWSTENKTHQNFSSMEVSDDNKIYVSIGNCIIDRATKALVRGCKGSVIPDDGSVEVIGERAFYFVKGLTSLNIPDCVTVIENNAFFFCRDLNEITLPANLRSLGEEAFHYCNMLVTVDLNGYTVLPRAVFKNCYRLEELKGSENITEIGENAFDSCWELKITLGASLKKIGKYAFLNFSNNITYQGTKAEWNAIEKDIYWVAHSRAAGKLKLVICTNGGIEVTSTTVNN